VVLSEIYTEKTLSYTEHLKFWIRINH
jgi:hypothetical protein